MTDDNPSPIGFFLAIVCVVGGTLLMPPFPAFFTIIGPLLLLVLTPILSIYTVRYWKERRFIQGSQMHMNNLEKYTLAPWPQTQMPPQHKGKHSGGAGSSAVKKYALLFLILAFLLFTGWQVFLYINDASPGRPGQSGVVSNNAHIPPEETAFSNQPVVHYQRPNFEAGIVFPQWSSDAYGSDWQQQLPAIQTQTGARWMEMTIFFSQSSPTSTQVKTNQSTPTVRSFADGVRVAHALGYHVFVVPLIGVDSPAGQWAGTIQFSTYQDAAQWFDSYWQAFEPYVVAATQAGADQVAIGTEFVELQQSAPPELWNTLISRVRSVFPGIITYDMNWTSLSQRLPAWMSNSQLAMIGVSEYLPLVNDRIRVEPKNIFGLWKNIVKSALDNFSLRLGKPVIISEIGYRNSADTLYHPWVPYSTVSPPDPEEQAAACDAALANVIPDPHIDGIFFWGWDNVDGFKLSGQSAIEVLNKWYTSPQS